MNILLFSSRAHQYIGWRDYNEVKVVCNETIVSIVTLIIIITLGKTVQLIIILGRHQNVSICTYLIISRHKLI